MKSNNFIPFYFLKILYSHRCLTFNSLLDCSIRIIIISLSIFNITLLKQTPHHNKARFIMMKLKILSLRILAAIIGIPIYMNMLSFGGALANGKDFLMVIVGILIVMLSLFLPFLLIVKMVLRKADEKQSSFAGANIAAHENDQLLI